MRWLARKDLLILGRSRLLVGVLVLYPVAIALLLGFAISRAPARPRVAIVDEAAPGETVRVGAKHVLVSSYARQVFSQVDAVQAHTRSQAVAEVDSGEALAAVVIPADLAARVASDLQPAHIEVLYNGNAIEQSLVRSTLTSALAQANLGFSEQIQKAAAEVIDALLRGGNLSPLGAGEHLIGLERIPATLHALIAREPPGSTRVQLEDVAAFASFAADNLVLAKQVLATVSQPIHVHSVLLHGRRTPLDAFAVVVAVSVSLMFVCVLLAAGSLALEREENVYPRLVRGLVSREALVAEKALLAAACAFVLALAMLAAIGAFVALDFSRVGLWVLALAFASVAFGALGVALGVLAREVRAASLLAILSALPLALLALVPSGAVSAGLYDAIQVVSFAFPFKPALEALDNAVNRSAPGIWGPLAHLAVLAGAFAALARLGLRDAS